ncbi:uncharacterized protein L969DRAFT_88608 [Mixia osmundae IAM 14324]|uniref:Pali-domain-containing protein n=1 Tax=Mixia osmundae (strain CBS 9802 / IAM 14324 / JCM 22182 / KY 12970) TaxID=764103 RepID=G7E6M8_MIXOS|nr:uncharacterized protein L969DRAFT_88608 [Mixia osmundae IAM 14324]KEI39134.1 hypothetical protein L969DRAFT_88608 [Mixia osmundae IAM 14324]GAA98488.1 hypothetical protein E5Q_05174 [Mixia osmundae IAM 14324]
MGVGNAVNRVIAVAFLTASAVMFLIICISTPVFKQFTFLSTTLGDGTLVRAGIWGYCVRNPQGVESCPHSSVGYVLNAAGLPGYTGSGPATTVIVGKPLSTALILYVLTFGQNLLALQAAFLPFRLVTIIALVLIFMLFGIGAISLLISFIVYSQANSRMYQQFPNGTVSSRLGNCNWLGLAAVCCTILAFIFLLIAMPAKERPRDEKHYTWDDMSVHDDNSVVDEGRSSKRSRGYGTSGYGSRSGRSGTSYSSRTRSERSSRSGTGAGSRSYNTRSRDGTGSEAYEDEHEMHDRRTNSSESSVVSRYD